MPKYLKTLEEIGFDQRIQGDPEDRTSWICLCGNDSTKRGFVKDDPYVQNGLYMCVGCGRVIDRKTLTIVGASIPDFGRFVF